MLTRWGRAVAADTVLNDYPRPQMVRDQWLSLNGTWQYAVTKKTAPEPEHWDGDILVPFCIEAPLSGVARALAPEERLWYRRSFQLEAKERRTLLHFGAVDCDCAVWINGGLAGTHSGGFAPFHLDITEFLRSGGNEVVVAVTDPTSSGDQPRGKQHLKPQGIWYTPVSGIWQTVWLEQVPAPQHIEELRARPTADCDAIDCTVFLNRPTRSAELAVHVRVSLAGELITEVTLRPDRQARIPIPDPQLWSPDQPTLYDMTASLVRVANPLPEEDPATLLRNVPQRGKQEANLYANASVVGEPMDQVRGYFGLRHVAVGAHPESGQPTLLLNGAPVFQLGTLDQGWWPDGLHTPPADEAMVHEIEFLKAAGFNTLRKHIKVEPARYYYHCDRLGLMVWQDMPSGFLPAQFVAPNDEGEAARSSRATERFELELQRMIHHLGGHPCIVMWVLHNEGWGQFDTARLTERIRALDPERLVNSASGWRDAGSGDVIDRHDYGEEPQAPAGDGRRALVVGEYGGIGWPLEGHLWNPEMRNWGYQTHHSAEEMQAAYRRVTDAIVALHREQGLAGAIYTQTTDVEGEVNGLLTYDREVAKLPCDWLARAHQPLTG